MAGCGTCPDQCSCVIVDQCGDQYAGAGSDVAPLVIPRRYDYPWVGESSDGSITITPSDVRNPADCSDADGHAPDLVVDFCNVIDGDDVNDGDILVVRDEDADCRPHRLRDPLPGEVLSRDPVTGRSGWVGGVASFGGDVPYGVPLEFWGDEGAVPGGWSLADFGLLDIVDNPNLFSVIGFNASGGVDPGGGQFHKPDKRGYVAAGRDDMGGTPANRITDPTADVLGGTLGVESAALTIANLPAHTHPLAITAAATGVTVTAAASAVSLGASGTGIGIVAVGDHVHTLLKTTGGGGSITNGAQILLGTNINTLVQSGAGSGVVDAVSVEGLQSTTSGAGTHAHGVSDPGHSHSVTNGAHGHPISDPGHTHTGTANTNPAMVADPVSRLQPTQFVNYIIRLG